jgi:hypothetical protein
MRPFENPRVGGSIPPLGTIKYLFLFALPHLPPCFYYLEIPGAHLVHILVSVLPQRIETDISFAQIKI